MSYLIGALGAIFVMGIFTGLAAWLLAKQEPRGKHHAMPPMRVQADLDQETIQVFRTMNNPPPEFFGNDPEWVEAARNWHISRSSVRGLTEDVASDARRIRQIRAELRQMYDAA